MDYFYEARGHLFGFHICQIVEWAKFIRTKFKAGDLAWVLVDAKRGKINPVAIRRVIIRNGGDTYRGVVVEAYYEDSFHGVWEEDMLVNHAEAIAWAVAYWESVEEDLARAPTCG